MAHTIIFLYHLICRAKTNVIVAKASRTSRVIAVISMLSHRIHWSHVSDKLTERMYEDAYHRLRPVSCHPWLRIRTSHSNDGNRDHRPYYAERRQGSRDANSVRILCKYNSSEEADRSLGETNSGHIEHLDRI